MSYIKKQPLLDKCKRLAGGSFSTPLIIAEIEKAEEFENKDKEMPEIVFAHIMGIIAMTCGFISMLTQNNAGAYGCFGFAFILWCVLSVEEFKNKKRGTD